MHRIGRFVIEDQAQGPATEIGWHRHDAPLLSLVLQGHYEERYTCCVIRPKAYDVVAKPGGERHADRVLASGARSLLVSIPDEDDGLGSFAESLTAPRLISAPSVRHLSRRAAMEWAARDDLSALSIEALLLELVVLLARRRETRAAPRWLRRVEEHLRDAFPRTVSLSELGAAHDVHPAHLARTFRRFKGCTVGDYARGLRVEAAVRGLTETTRPLAEVALASGFCDQAHMGRVLKKYMGRTPAEIRRRLTR